MEAAKTVLAKTDATQEEIDQAKKDLQEAYDGLTEVTTDPVNTSELKGLVEEYSKITEQGDYTDESWKAFRKALEEAERVLADVNVTQAEIDSAKSALEEAYKGLTKTEDPTPAREGLWAEWTDEWAELLSNDNTITYTGKAIKPTVKVYDGETLLTNKSYSVTYKNNTKVGEASVIIKGKGNYTGNYTMKFNIGYVDLENDSDVSIADLYVAASKNGKPVSVKPVVTWKGKKVNAKSYEVELPDKAEEGTDVIPYVTPGTYNVIVKAKENNGIYIGEKEIKITLADTANDAQVLMSAVKVKFNFKSKQWTDEAGGVTLDANDIKVTYKNAELLLGNDFELTYENNDRIGTATVIITGTGTPENKGKFVGKLRKTFKITGTAIKANDVVLELGTEPIVYNGEAHEPTVKIGALNKDSDYTVAYQNNINAGKKATVIITGINGYSGTVKKTFTIAAHDVNQDDVSIAVNGNEPAAYEKGGSKPLVDVTFDGRTLVPGTDYTVSYAKNTKVTEGATAEVRITGKGNFTQKKTVTFAIAKQSLAGLTATAADQTSAKKWNKVNPVITDKNGKTLKKGTDYENTLAYVLYDKNDNVVDTATTQP
ncbi:MAG: FIVAR domain-containing protein, partial [Lachnospiraceae bacterium]|nr:FIVAR domain-containing protein [Lachnospiraceae bacterium]